VYEKQLSTVRRHAADDFAGGAITTLAFEPRVRDRDATTLETGEDAVEACAPEDGGGRTVEYDHGGVGVDIDHEAWARIALAVDDAPTGAANEQWIASASTRGSFGTATRPVGVARGIGREIEDARAQRRRGIGQCSSERTVFVHERDDVTDLDGARRPERAVVDPRVTCAHGIAQRLGDAPAGALHFSCESTS
jgi:hypothetical protein